MTDIISATDRRLPDSLKPSLQRAASVAWGVISRGEITTSDGNVFSIPIEMKPLDYLALRRGRYERPLIDIVRKHFARESGTIIEVGAGFGVVARYGLGEKLERDGKYVCIEPDPDAIALLSANMYRAQRLHPKRDITIIRAAIGDASSAATEQGFSIHLNPLSNLIDRIRVASKREVTTRVATTSLGAIMRDHQIRGPISLICHDPKGAEIDILKDTDALSAVRQIAIELHGPKVTGRRETPQDLLDSMAEAGFRKKARLGNAYYLTREM